jgi:hypothetical protein
MDQAKCFRDNLFEGRLTRRQAGCALAAAGVMSLAMPTLSRPAAAACQGENLTFFTWGGYDDPNFLGPYIEQYGCEPSYALLAGEDEAMSKMLAGFAPQVIYPCSGVIKRWKDADLIVPVDVSLLSNWPDVLPVTKDIPGTVFDGERYFVPEDFGQTRSCPAPIWRRNMSTTRPGAFSSTRNTRAGWVQPACGATTCCRPPCIWGSIPLT